MIRYLIFTFVSLLTLTLLNAQEESKSTEQFLMEIDQKIPKLLHDFTVPGAAIAIINDGMLIHQKGYGFANVEKGIKVKEKTGFNIGSISKTVAAWGVMKLVQEGKIDLDAPAEKYLTRWHLPESEFDSDDVTIRRLLSHTAGLSLHGYPGWSPKDELPSVEESLNGKNNGPGRVEIIMEPGSRYRYSGGGITILQLIVEEVTGMPFEDYLQENVVDPLGMTNSSYKIAEEIMAASSHEYDNYGEEIDFELFTAQAAAGLHTTIEDFTRFAYASLYLLMDHQQFDKVLHPHIIQKMMEKVPQAGGHYGYGLGYASTSIPGTDIILKGHRGANTGWQAIFNINPDTNDGFIMFTNGGSGQNIYNPIFYDWVLWKTGARLEDWYNAKPSISRKLKSMIKSEGINDIAQKYWALKEDQADKYDFSENQLNELGYHYLASDEVEKAVEIFKLNVEAFPNAFNTYDSYGESLLQQGQTQEAIKNYFKSIELNPANQNAYQALNKLDISSEEIVRKISYSVDNSILQGYIGQYVNSSDEILSIQLMDELLIASFKGQQTTLFPESDTRFRIIQDGTAITFFKDVNHKNGLWLNQGIWMRISEPTKNNPGEIMNNSNENVLSTKKYLVLRNNHSWGRSIDFENVLEKLEIQYKMENSAEIEELNLMEYDVIIIPGAQIGDFYNDYIKNSKKINQFVLKGGKLVMELNGAEGHNIILPENISITSNGAYDNLIVETNHPVFSPFIGQPQIRANFASHGFFTNVPENAKVLAVENGGGEKRMDRPTFIEYSYGKGTVLAAMQCFHDQDNSGRGPFMLSVINYVLEKSGNE